MTLHLPIVTNVHAPLDRVILIARRPVDQSISDLVRRPVNQSISDLVIEGRVKVIRLVTS